MTRTKLSKHARKMLLIKHPLLQKLDPLSIEVAFQLIEKHNNIKVYRTGKEIILSRDAAYSNYRELFTLK